MNILSEIWLQSWSTLYILRLKVDYPKDNMKIVDDIMERYGKWKIPMETFELYYSVSSEVFLLIDKWLDIALQNGVKIIFVSLSPKVEYDGDGCFIGCMVLLREKVGVDCVEDKMREVRTKKGCKLGFRVDWKKYLLVLDEVWNKDNLKWPRLKNMLVGGTKGSKILLTTHSDVVAEEEVGVSTVC
ncbi:hypothetical protein P3S67_002002 [Capsicum chacoense]